MENNWKEKTKEECADKAKLYQQNVFNNPNDCVDKESILNINKPNL